MKKELILSIVITLSFLSLGFLLLHYELIGYGLSFFVFLPFTIGYILGQSTIKKFSLYGLIFSLAVFFVLLLIGGLEGMVCILMAMPIVIIALLIGYAIKQVIDRDRTNRKSGNIIKGSILPLFFFLGFGFFERMLTKNDKEVNSITTDMTVPYLTTELYETIKSVDTLIADKPFLMKLDLPIPNKCVLEKEEVGGLRTCYFSGGTITERITQLEKAKVLRMDVIDYKLTGRKWLGFKEAIYYFAKAGKDSCKITRVTTYTSVLTPRFYWQPLEKIGISQEHDYVFDNLKRDLKRKYRR
jgi:hypothetical protein